MSYYKAVNLSIRHKVLPEIKINRFAGLLSLLAFFMLFISGCSSSSGGSDAPAPVPSKTASVKYIFDFAQYKAVGKNVQTFEFSGYNAALQREYGIKSVKRSEFAPDGSIVLTEVPLTVKSFVAMMKDKDGNPCGLTQNSNVNLTAGGYAVIDHPNFASTAGELGERLDSIKIAPEEVSLNIGDTAEFKAEGVFKCSNGIKLESDLTNIALWKTSDSSVAAASEGTAAFKAVNPGSAEIYAVIGKKQGKANIAVNPPAEFASDIHVNLSKEGMPSGVKVEARGYDKENNLLLACHTFEGSEASDFTLEDVSSKISKVVLTVFEEDGQVYAYRISGVSLVYGKTYELNNPGLITGNGLMAKASLKCEASSAAVNMGETVKASGILTWTFINGVYSFEQTEDAYFTFASSNSELLKETEASGLFEGIAEGTAKLTASYKGIVSDEAKVTVIDPSKFNINISYAENGLPKDSSIIIYQLFKEGEAVSDEIIKDSDTSVFLHDTASEADSLVTFVKNSDRILVGALYQEVVYESHLCTLSNTSVKQGNDMGAYVSEITCTADKKIASIDSSVTFKADAKFAFGSDIEIERTVTEEAVWSSSDFSAGSIPGRYTVGHAGQSAAAASVGGRKAEAFVLANGIYQNKAYKYAEADSLTDSRAGVLISYCPDDAVTEGSAEGQIESEKAESSGTITDSITVRTDKISVPGMRVMLEDLPGRSAERLKSELSSAALKDIVYDTAADSKFVDAQPGDVIENLYAEDISGVQRTFSAKVLIADKNNAEDVSGQVIVLAEIVDGNPVLNMDEALNFDKIMGSSNPFDNEGKGILERVRSCFGHEAGYGIEGAFKGGMDKTEKVIFIFLDPDTLTNGSSVINGYFNPRDEYPKAFYSDSNVGEILYINPEALTSSPGDTYSTAAHEFQHLVNFNEKYYHDGAKNGDFSCTMLNEGAAVLSSYLCGFGLNDREADGISYSGIYARIRCSEYLSDISSGNIKEYDTYKYGINFSYGEGSMLMEYVYDVYGLDVIKDYISRNKRTLKLKDDYDVLAYSVSKASGTEITFAELYRDFGMACMLSGTNVSGSIPSRYQLKTVVPGKTYTGSLLASVSKVSPKTWNLSSKLSASSIVPWSNSWYLTPVSSSASYQDSCLIKLSGSAKNLFDIVFFSKELKFEEIAE